MLPTTKPNLVELAAFPLQDSKTLHATLVTINPQSGEVLAPPFRYACDGAIAKGAAAQLAEWYSGWIVPMLFDRPNVAAVMLPVIRPARMSVFVIHAKDWSDAQLLDRLAAAIATYPARHGG